MDFYLLFFRPERGYNCYCTGRCFGVILIHPKSFLMIRLVKTIAINLLLILAYYLFLQLLVYYYVR
jgi:hypothetical protein